MNVWNITDGSPAAAVGPIGARRRGCGGVGAQDPVWNNGRVLSQDVPQPVRLGGNPVLPVLFHLGITASFHLPVPPTEPLARRHRAGLFLEKKTVALIRKREDPTSYQRTPLMDYYSQSRLPHRSAEEWKTAPVC